MPRGARSQKHTSQYITYTKGDKRTSIIAISSTVVPFKFSATCLLPNAVIFNRALGPDLSEASSTYILIPREGQFPLHAKWSKMWGCMTQKSNMNDKNQPKLVRYLLSSSWFMFDQSDVVTYRLHQEQMMKEEAFRGQHTCDTDKTGQVHVSSHIIILTQTSTIVIVKITTCTSDPDGSHPLLTNCIRQEQLHTWSTATTSIIIETW